MEFSKLLICELFMPKIDGLAPIIKKHQNNLTVLGTEGTYIQFVDHLVSKLESFELFMPEIDGLA